MPCNNPEHDHPTWPTSGTLIIQRCEVFCAFCEGDKANHRWKFAWFLRRHIEGVHIKHGPYKNLTVSPGW